MLLIYILLVLLGAYYNTKYNKNLIFNRFLVVKNERNKIALPGVIFLILTLILLICTFVFLLIMPEKPIIPYEFDEGILYYNFTSLNEVFLVISFWILFSFEMLFYSINQFNVYKTVRKKKTTFVINVLSIIVFLGFFIFVLWEIYKMTEAIILN